MLYYINPLTWFAWIGSFLAAWFEEIPWKKSAPALPALVLLVLIFSGTVLSFAQGSGWRAMLVERQIRDALATEDFQVAELLLKRQIRKMPSDKDLQYLLGTTYEAMGEPEETARLFRKLALAGGRQEDQGAKGWNERAARWLLENEYDLKEQDVSQWSQEQIDEFGKITEMAVKFSPNNASFRAKRADYARMTRDLELETEQFEFLAKANPLAGLRLAALYRAQGDESEARAAANRANRRFRELVEDEPGKPALRLLHARGLVFLKDYQAAFEVLYEGYAEYGQDPDLRKAVGEVLVLYARSLESEPQTLETIRKRLRTLEQALKFAPDNPVVMRSITDTVLAAAESEDAEIAQLREALIDGASPGMAHFIRGTIAMMQDRPQEAAVELQLASKEMPQSSTVLNNLAVARTKLAAKRDNDMGLLEEALRLIDKAIDLVGDAPTSRMQRAYFRETRGQVLLAMGKHLEAIPEFEAALAVDALEEQANRSIAKCYEALDLPDRAAEHRREAERLAAANAQAGEDASEQGVGDSTDTSQAADGQQPLESSDQP